LLKSLEFQVEPLGEDALKAVAPAHRLDIQEGPADLIEDLARLYGYDKLPSTLLRDELPAQATNEPVAFEEQVRDRMVGEGLQEVISYALTTPQREAPLALPAVDYVTLRNPISAERAVMRQSLLTGALEAAAANLRHTAAVRLFEVGSVYLPRAGQKLPDEPRRLGIVLCGRRGQDFWGDGAKRDDDHLDFFELKGILEGLLADLHVVGSNYRSAKPAHLHPGKAAEIVAKNKLLGTMGELHPKTAEAFGLAGRAVLVAELDLEALRAVTPARHAYVPVGRFPAALRDVAVVVEQNVPAEKVAAEIRSGGGELLRDIRLFDLYQGDSIAADHKSLAFALAYQAEDRTLTDKEVDKAHKKIEDRLRHVLKAQIRGEDS
jgi:phenylalanyl-tRNA synthetase beta chain